MFAWGAKAIKLRNLPNNFPIGGRLELKEFMGLDIRIQINLRIQNTVHYNMFK